MEEIYKQEFLHDIASHAEILVYDWSNGGEIELVVEDIERIGKWGHASIEFVPLH